MPSIPENVTNFQVFDDDQHILDFIANRDIFEAHILDEKNKEDHAWEEEQIMDLPSNKIPKGMI